MPVQGDTLMYNPYKYKTTNENAKQQIQYNYNKNKQTNKKVQYARKESVSVLI